MSGSASISVLEGWSPYLFIFVFAVLPTAIWRWLGVALAGRISEDGELLVWVRAIATALIAAVIAKLVLYPTGSLAEIAVSVRMAAVIAGFGFFIVARHNVAIGVLTAEVVLIAGEIAF